MPRKPLDAITPEETRPWSAQTRTALLRKMQRERAYLDRRKARSFFTPTDEAYEPGQILESDLLVVLDEMDSHSTARKDAV